MEFALINAPLDSIHKATHSLLRTGAINAQATVRHAHSSLIIVNHVFRIWLYFNKVMAKEHVLINVQMASTNSKTNAISAERIVLNVFVLTCALNVKLGFLIWKITLHVLLIALQNIMLTTIHVFMGQLKQNYKVIRNSTSFH